jgi:lactoylglutathione lyase
MNETTDTQDQPPAAIECKLGWVIVYVDKPTEASDYYVRTFGLRAEFASPEGSYAQLDKGLTKLAFASYELGERNFPGGVRRPGAGEPPPNCEVTLVADDVDAVYAAALKAGCVSLAEPADKPHGQRVAWVRDPFGTLVELGTPM